MIKKSSEAMGAALVNNNFSPIPQKLLFHIKKKILVVAQYLQSITTFLTLELSQYSKSGSMFSSSETIVASSNCSQFGNTLCLISTVRPAQAVPERGPKSLAIDLAVKTFNYLQLPSGAFGSDFYMTGRGSNLDSNLNFAA